MFLLVKTKIRCLIPLFKVLSSTWLSKMTVGIELSNKITIPTPYMNHVYCTFWLLTPFLSSSLFRYVFCFIYNILHSFYFLSGYVNSLDILSMLLQLVVNCECMRYPYPNREENSNGSFCELLPCSEKMGHFYLHRFYSYR